MMYYLFILGKILCLIFPRQWCYFLAKILATVHFYLSKKDRDAVKYNLSPIVEDEKRCTRSTHQVFVNFSYYLVDFFRYSKLDQNFIKKYVKVEGINFLQESLSKKKGVVSLTAHLGNYELGGAVVALLGYPIYAVALPHKDKRTNEFFNRHRRRVGIGVIPTGVSVKQCFSVLKKGAMIAFLGDRDFTAGAGIEAEMFSRRANIPRGAFYFAMRTGAAIVPSFFVRQNKKFYRLIFEKPIWEATDASSLLTEEAQAAVIKNYILILEKYLRMYPEQWYMFEKYWVKDYESLGSNSRI
ncbi:MAG: lysophospholipid acyltransferase family protein [Candidatus Omnitrophota bacterium]|nr:MAG: lysophospholipid acyltransferase family protein [Candidatus Omnitrophota bacterium]